MNAARRLALAAAVALAACAQEDTVAIDDRAAGADAGVPAYCLGEGPPILVGDGITVGEGDGTGDDVCSGTVAVRTFRFALCTCEGYDTSTTLATDSFDSTAGPYAPGGTRGSVGVNGRLATNAPATIGGSLWLGPGGAGLGGDLTLAGDLRDGGELGLDVGVAVGRDAHVSGAIDLAALTVAGTLTVPEGQPITVDAPPDVGALVRAPVAVPLPCACAPDDLVDIAGFALAHRDANDNALIGLDPATLVGMTGDRTLELPCGRFFLDGVSGGGALTLRATGRTALFVGGDVAPGASLLVELAAGAELDLFIAGTLTAAGEIRFGDPARPARTRLYVGGGGAIALSGAALFAGNLYAPLAELQASAGATLFGSLFVRHLVTAAPLTIHYDTAVLDADQGCPVGAATCESCLDCGNQACAGGTCGACTDSSECCAPLVCAGGVCVP